MTSPDGRLLMWDPAVGGLAVVQPAASDVSVGEQLSAEAQEAKQRRFARDSGSWNFLAILPLQDNRCMC